MSRFYVSEESVKGDKIYIAGKEAHHILDVMHLKKTDRVVAFDGTGKEHIGFIKEVKRGSLLVEIVETRTPIRKEKTPITLIQAIPKKERMDYIVEKATELGVDSVIPIITDRTIVRWGEDKKVSSVERWRRIAKESAKQCGRVKIPEVANIMAFGDVIKNSSDYDLTLIATLTEGALRLKDTLGNFKGGRIAIAIGPEGDFTLDEIGRAKEAGFRLVNLGPRVLKSDTAGPAVLAILNYELSD